MYDIPFDRSFLLLSNGIRHVMPSTDRKLELTAKASMAQPVSQPALCCYGLTLAAHETVCLATRLGRLMPGNRQRRTSWTASLVVPRERTRAPVTKIVALRTTNFAQSYPFRGLLKLTATVSNHFLSRQPTASVRCLVPMIPKAAVSLKPEGKQKLPLNHRHLPWKNHEIRSKWTRNVHLQGL